LKAKSSHKTVMPWCHYKHTTAGWSSPEIRSTARG